MAICLAGADGEVVSAQLHGFPFTRAVEPIGPLYLKLKREAALAAAGKAVAQEEDVDDAEDVEEEDFVEMTSKQRKKFLTQNYYECLGVPFMHDNAGDIKNAYHRMLLHYHPDKTGLGETDPVFMRIQDAFNTLSDMDKRRPYDSQCDFNDKVPKGTEDTETDEEFLKVYRPVFERNARFSNKLPVPDVGTPASTLAELEAFYKWWHNFDSWRDFNHDLKHNLDVADGRDERRYMEVENNREIKRRKKTEVTRVANFVELAEKKDPRIRRMRQAIVDARKKELDDKKKAAFAVKNAANIKAEAAAADKAAADKTAKDAAFAAKGNAKEIKKDFRKSKHQLKTLCVKAIEKDGQGKSLDDWMADVEKMCGSFKLIAETQPIIDKMGGAAAMEDDSKLAADAPATMAAAVEAARPNF